MGATGEGQGTEGYGRLGVPPSAGCSIAHWWRSGTRMGLAIDVSFVWLGVWQHHCGTLSRNAYHNREWAATMDAIDLCPSDTGKPGGKRTGQHMSHSVVAGGPFAKACTDLIAEGLVISWRDRGRAQVPGKRKMEGKAGMCTTDTCPHCGLNAWVKADVGLRCGACKVALAPAGA